MLPDEMMLKPTGDQDDVKTQTDATALRRGDSRSQLRKKSGGFCGCHGLVPWRLTFIAEGQALITKSIKRETPRGKAVASKFEFSHTLDERAGVSSNREKEGCGNLRASCWHYLSLLSLLRLTRKVDHHFLIALAVI